jgi:hypothetical protein
VRPAFEKRQGTKSRREVVRDRRRKRYGDLAAARAQMRLEAGSGSDGTPPSGKRVDSIRFGASGKSVEHVGFPKARIELRFDFSAGFLIVGNSRASLTLSRPGRSSMMLMWRAAPFVARDVTSPSAGQAARRNPW